jgi:hypothetical protein
MIYTAPCMFWMHAYPFRGHRWFYAQEPTMEVFRAHTEGDGGAGAELNPPAWADQVRIGQL